MIKLKNVTATSEGIPVIKNIDLDIRPGEVHALVGPKFSGKSAVAHIITGHPSLKIESGKVQSGRKNITDLDVEERSKNIFVSFQNPPDFEDFAAWELYQEFFDLPRDKIEDLRLKYEAGCDFLGLGNYHGVKMLHPTEISESEFKRNELLQMILSDPKFIIIDEIDSGMNAEEFALAGLVIKEFLSEKNRSGLIISRNLDFLDIIEPTHAHLMANGQIRASGSGSLYKRIVNDEYSEFP